MTLTAQFDEWAATGQDRGMEAHHWNTAKHALARVPIEERDIPPESAFPTEEWDSRAAMIDRFRTWGTLLTVGVAP